MYSFWDASVLSRKNLFRIHNYFILTFCHELSLVCFKVLNLHRGIFVKISIKMLRKCWYFILIMSFFQYFVVNFCSKFIVSFLVTVKPFIGPHLLNLLLLDQAHICFSENGCIYVNSIGTIDLRFPLGGRRWRRYPDCKIFWWGGGVEYMQCTTFF